MPLGGWMQCTGVYNRYYLVRSLRTAAEPSWVLLFNIGGPISRRLRIMLVRTMIVKGGPQDIIQILAQAST